MVKYGLQCGRPAIIRWVRKIPRRREWQPNPVFLPGESHGQRSLLGYYPWDHKEWDMTEGLTLSLTKMDRSPVDKTTAWNWVPSLIGELRLHMPWSAVKKFKKQIRKRSPPKVSLLLILWPAFYNHG